ncbi:hypothetical protein DFH09DRAFT_1339386 [Mycena vulgaris]|nr:hypothetical protein DFH09DRAFT_1339386 [Mycena vulgaris]
MERRATRSQKVPTVPGISLGPPRKSGKRRKPQVEELPVEKAEEQAQDQEDIEDLGVGNVPAPKGRPLSTAQAQSRTKQKTLRADDGSLPGAPPEMEVPPLQTANNNALPPPPEFNALRTSLLPSGTEASLRDQLMRRAPKQPSSPEPLPPTAPAPHHSALPRASPAPLAKLSIPKPVIPRLDLGILSSSSVITKGRQRSRRKLPSNELPLPLNRPNLGVVRLAAPLTPPLALAPLPVADRSTSPLAHALLPVANPSTPTPRLDLLPIHRFDSLPPHQCHFREAVGLAGAHCLPPPAPHKPRIGVSCNPPPSPHALAVSVLVREERLESDGDATEDDYEEAANKKERELINERERFSGSKHLRLQEEEDAEEDAEFEAEAMEDPEVGGRRRGNSKGKSKAKEDAPPAEQGRKGKAKEHGRPESEKEKSKSKPTAGASSAQTRIKKKQTPVAAADADADDTDEDEAGGRHKAGPIDKESQALLFGWQEDLEAKVEALATKLKKPSSLLWSLIDGSHKDVRSTSAWNMFQSWLYTPAPEGGGQVHDKAVTKEERGRLDRAEYDKLLEDLTPEDRKKTSVVLEHVPWLAEWHEHLEERVRQGRLADGGMTREMAKLGRVCASLSSRAWKELNVHLVGYIISTAGGSKSFGASEAYQLFRKRHQGQTTRTLKEYESNLHVLEMEIAGATAAAVLKTKQQREMAFPSASGLTGNALRDAERKFIRDAMAADIVTIQVERGLLTPEEAASSTQLMHWGTWGNFAFTNQLRIENWDDEMAARKHFPKSGFAVTAFAEKDLDRVKHALEVRHGRPPADDEDAEIAEKALRIVSWTDDEIEMSLTEQGDIPLITTTSGIILRYADECTKYQTQVSGPKQKQKKQNAPKTQIAVTLADTTHGAVRVPHRDADTVRVPPRHAAVVATPLPGTVRVPHQHAAVVATPLHAPAPAVQGQGRHPAESEHAPLLLYAAGVMGRGPGIRSNEPDPPRPAKKARPEAGPSMSKAERQALTKKANSYLAEDAAEKAASLVKFKLVKTGEQSPVILGQLKKTSKGMQGRAERHTRFQDKNTDEWVKLWDGFAAVFEDEHQVIYDKYVKRWELY